MFEDYLYRTEKLLYRLEKNEDVDSFIKKMVSFYKVTELLYPEELNYFLEKQKVKETLDKVSKTVNRSLDKLQGIQMDYPAQRVIFNDKTSDMVSAKKFVLEGLKVNEQAPGHYLIMSLVSDQSVFELIQLYFFLKEH